MRPEWMSWPCAQVEGNILPRDSLAEIMAAEEVVAAKAQLHAAQLQHRAPSFDSSKSLTCEGALPACPLPHAGLWLICSLQM